MFKANGMLNESNKEEKANLKRKTLICKTCGIELVAANVYFGEVTCKKCGDSLTELYGITSKKETGVIK